MKCKNTLILLAAFLALSPFVGARNPRGNVSGATGPNTIVLAPSMTRVSGISPLLVFFDATNTTDSALSGAICAAGSGAVCGANNALQDVTYTWNFGDTGASGTGTWAYGSNPNNNSKNKATGFVAAHLYIVTPGGGDKTFVASVTATDGSSTASYNMPTITVYDPSGANGFPGTATTCFYNSTLGSGCPAGATQTVSSSISAPGSGHLFLYKCGDSFSGSMGIGNAITKAGIDAYGSCVGTAISAANHGTFPKFTGTDPITITSSNTSLGPIDVRFSNIDFEGAGGTHYITNGVGFNNKQILMYNLYANSGVGSSAAAYYLSGATESGLVQSLMVGETSIIGTFWNYFGNYCLNTAGSGAYQCSQGASAVYNNVNYNAIIGNSLNGVGATTSASGIETLRISACRLCVVENNTSQNANNTGAVLKLHDGSNQSQAQWIGQYAELIEISDNLFTGTSGAQLVEVGVQNQQYDERMRNIVIERNVFQGGNTGGIREIWVGGNNITLRDNAFAGALSSAADDMLIVRRGGEWQSCTANYPGCTPLSAAPVDTSEPQHIEVYNNTCAGGGTCVDGNRDGFGVITAPFNNSFIANNIFYNTTGVSGAGTGSCGGANCINNNSTNTAANPGFTDGSGTYLQITDYKPTANYTGSTSVPVWYDALAQPWLPTWNLGAVHY